MKKGVIVSHKEGCAMGIASNHGDPDHLWKGLGLSYTMDGFRSDVKKAIQDIVNSGTAESKNKLDAYLRSIGDTPEKLEKELSSWSIKDLNNTLKVEVEFKSKTKHAENKSI